MFDQRFRGLHLLAGDECYQLKSVGHGLAAGVIVSNHKDAASLPGDAVDPFNPARKRFHAVGVVVELRWLIVRREPLPVIASVEADVTNRCAGVLCRPERSANDQLVDFAESDTNLLKRCENLWSVSGPMVAHNFPRRKHNHCFDYKNQIV